MIQAKTKNIIKKLKPFKKENIRFLPEKYSSKIGYLIYGNTVAIGLIGNNDITIIKITSKEFVKGYKNYFELLWKIAVSLRTF